MDTNDDHGLGGLREGVTRGLLTLLWVHVPLDFLVARMLGSDWQPWVLGSAGLAAAATLSWWIAGSVLATRLTVAMALVGTISLLVWQFAGNPWQPDLHMYYFAGLAVLATYCDWQVLVLAASAIAMHHLGLNFVLPAAIYPGGADLGRAVLHAIIVALETASLVWLAVRLVTLFERAAAKTAEAEAAHAAEHLASEERIELELRTSAAKREAALLLAASFEAAVEGLVRGVATDMGRMQGTAETLAGMASQAAGRTSAIASSCEAAASGVQTIAAATEELALTVHDVTDQVRRAAAVAEGAVREASATDAMVRDLAVAAGRIGEVVRLIGDVAGRTNLLALNATIEAARAGEAGRGFAVVAGEVKVLAAQTARATQEIQVQIAAIQTETGRAVDAIAAITGTVGELGGITVAVAAAVEQQGAAAREIARNAQCAAAGTEGVSVNLGGLSRVTDDTGSAAGEALAAASGLSAQVTALSAEVQRFVQGLRDAA